MTKKLLTGLLATAFIHACSSVDTVLPKVEQTPSQFTEVRGDFAREEKNLRQWDAAVVADLDQDGYPDLLLNDHGFAIRVLWNDQGRYQKPYDLLMGDAHGISVGDFDQDGLNEIIIARGGGSGSNARNSKIFKVDKTRQFSVVEDFDVPLVNMRGRTVKFVDLNQDGQLDLLNFAFPDNAKKGDSENYIYKNTGKGELKLVNRLPAIRADGQKTLVTDFNQDGFSDLVIYGHGPVKLYQGLANFEFIDVSKAMLPDGLNHVTSVAEIDFDNDGDFDLFFTRGKEFKGGDSFYDSETKVWGFFASRGQYAFPELEMGDIFDLENFQSQWPHKSLYIGESGYEYQYPGETHSGRDVRLVNSDALGFPDSFEKKGGYIGYVGNQQWRFYANTFSPMTGVVKGVASYPAPPVEPGLQDKLLENVGDRFVDVSNKFNLMHEGHSMGSAIGDYNNDGLTDILIVPRGNLVTPVQSILMLNLGYRGFKFVTDGGLSATELGAIGMSAQALDYNLDGQLDVITGNDRGKWHLFRNNNSQLQNVTPNNVKNNYLLLDIQPQNDVTPLGAVVMISACGRQQVKRIGTTSAMYSLSFNTQVHFGLGNCEAIDNIQVRFSNGKTSTATTNQINQLVTVQFGNDSKSSNSLAGGR